MRSNNRVLAHVRPNASGGFDEHWLDEHLLAVADIAGRYADVFSSRDVASLAGLWHDLGKYSEEFQHYIKSASGYERSEAHIEDRAKGRVNHSSAGAIYAQEKLGLPGRTLAYLIAGHHAGLPDWTKLEANTGGALRERLSESEHLAKALAAPIPENILNPDLKMSAFVGGRAGFAFWVRMLFSCLVDADFLDTEAFMDESRMQGRGGYPDLNNLLKHLNQYMSSLIKNADDTPVNRLRVQILDECRDKASDTPGLYSLTVPTGGGKTLSSMTFALEHAIQHQRARIIYAIPYTSIIEQTADTFRKVFGSAVVEHHSNLDPDKEDSKSRLATENWDSPIIVTTNVQFFESLFAARTSRCRKLHNIVNSVVVLDEAQLLPTEFMEPVLTVMNLLTEHYGVTFVLCTATQPALNSRKGFDYQFKGLENVKEIIGDPDALYQKLERVAVELPDDYQSPQSWGEIATALKSHDSVLAIVNTKRAARELHALMPEETIHLSSLMCGQHRSDLIENIKKRLKNGRPTRVISTQLVEAGVDMDFPVVYRALAGLDSIAQAAGRCNREGKLKVKGKVVVFVPPDPAPPGHLRRGEQTTIGLMTGFTGNPLSRNKFTQYFERFYAAAQSLDKHGIQDLLTPKGSGTEDLQVQFKTAANKFKLIDDIGQSVIVRYTTKEEKEDSVVAALLNQLRKNGPYRELMRRLQRYSVSVSDYHFKQLVDDYEIEEIWPGIYAQLSDTLYHPSLGLLAEDTQPSAESLLV